MPDSIEFFKKPKNWIWLILIFNWFYMALINYLNLPGSIVYFNDIACLILLHSLIMTYRRTDSIGAASFQLKIILFLFAETLIGYLANLYNPLTYLWGLRILFRFMIFFLASTIYVDEGMLDKFFTILYYILILNVILTTLQRLSGYSLDSVTGIFSMGRRIRGGSGGLNVFMCIVCTYFYVSAINKKCPMYKCIISMISCIYMAAIGELKMFYIELAIILVCVLLFTKFSVPKTIGTLFGMGIIFAGTKIYDYYYGDRQSMDLANLLDYAGVSGKSYGSEYSLNRLTAIPYVWNNILDDISKKLFGIGAGYADTVSSYLLSSGFLRTNGNLGFHLWSVSLELVNIGVVGLTLYILFFVSIFVYTCIAQRKDIENSNYYDMCKVIVVLCIVMMFYNTSLIIDISAPFLFFILAIPFILNNQKRLAKT